MDTSSAGTCSSILSCRILRQGFSSSVESSACSRRYLWAREVHLLTRAWLCACNLLTAILSSVADKRQRLRPTLDSGRDGTHALCSRGTDTTTIVPGVAVTWHACILRVLNRLGELGITVDTAVEDGPASAQDRSMANQSTSACQTHSEELHSYLRQI